MSQNIVIIGAGYTGLAAALDLTKQGFKVTLLEADKEIGGLAGSFEVSAGVRLEKFYHHWFNSDLDILRFIEEIGLSDRLERHNSSTGIYYANSLFRLSTPLDLLGFTPLPLLDRIRTGIMSLRARRITDWQALEALSAEEWLISMGGRRAFEVIWRPLLNGKFGPEASHVSAVWFWNKLKLRGSSRSKGAKEELVYFRGGFGALSDGIKNHLEQLGVSIRCNSPVQKIITKDGAVLGVQLDGELIPSTQVLSTVPLPEFAALVDQLPTLYRQQLNQIRFLGNVCLILRLKHSLSKLYWMNVADPAFPFVGIIEHTNFDDRARYNGEHIAYLSKYLPTSDPLFSMNEEQMVTFSLPHLRRMFPSFDPHGIIRAHLWKARYSQPVITKHYSKLIPEVRTPISGLWLATMAQIYPEDRGTNYAIRQGRAVANQIAASQPTRN